MSFKMVDMDVNQTCSTPKRAKKNVALNESSPDNEHEESALENESAGEMKATGVSPKSLDALSLSGSEV